MFEHGGKAGLKLTALAYIQPIFALVLCKLHTKTVLSHNYKTIISCISGYVEVCVCLEYISGFLV